MRELIGLGGEEIINTVDNKGYPPLVLAERLGHSEIREVLLEAGADPNEKDKYGHTAQDYRRAHLQK